jgi:uncharacterized BrkB/YihY/UPF0761 family membrane protein
VAVGGGLSVLIFCSLTKRISRWPYAALGGAASATACMLLTLLMTRPRSFVDPWSTHGLSTEGSESKPSEKVGIRKMFRSMQTLGGLAGLVAGLVVVLGVALLLQLLAGLVVALGIASLPWHPLGPGSIR